MDKTQDMLSESNHQIYAPSLCSRNNDAYACFDVEKMVRIIYIYKNLRKLGWSLQVVFERAKQIDLQERANYLYALHYHVKHPRHVLVLDETNSGRKSSVRRRCWSVQGQSPYLDCLFWFSWSPVFRPVYGEY